MDFGNLWNLFSGLFISCIGMGLFMYGKRAARLWPLLMGIAFCAYPFFVSSVLLMWLIAAAGIALLFILRDK
jgi:hypothetical protein